MSSETPRKEPHVSPGTSGSVEKKSPKSTVDDANPYTLVPLRLLDEPENAARETMDEVALAELAESIQRHGLIQPLVVERTGPRYRVIAGHRRLLACQILKFTPVPCLVRGLGEVDPVCVTLAENFYREAINPAEEAAFLDRLLADRCGGDTDLLAALIRRRREYVEDRLLLRRGDARVLDALARGEIALGVARELNKVRDESQRALYLDSAIRGGASAAVVKHWRVQGAVVEQVAGDDGANPPAPADQAAPAPAEPMRCFFCSDTEDPQLMEVHFLHKQCRKFLTRLLDRGPGSAEPRGKPGFDGILPPGSASDEGQ